MTESKNIQQSSSAVGYERAAPAVATINPRRHVLMARFMTAFRLPQGVKLPDNLNSELIRRVHPSDTRKIERIKALAGSDDLDFTRGPIFLGPVASFSGNLSWLKNSEVEVIGYELLGSPDVNLGVNRQAMAAQAA